MQHLNNSVRAIVHILEQPRSSLRQMVPTRIRLAASDAAGSFLFPQAPADSWGFFWTLLNRRQSPVRFLETRLPEGVDLAPRLPDEVQIHTSGLQCSDGSPFGFSPLPTRSSRASSCGFLASVYVIALWFFSPCGSPRAASRPAFRQANIAYEDDVQNRQAPDRHLGLDIRGLAPTLLPRRDSAQRLAVMVRATVCHHRDQRVVLPHTIMRGRATMARADAGELSLRLEGI
jgi:hypothetical protein